MEIEKFVQHSEGEWDSMRSGHSLAFKQFEEIISHIKITRLAGEDPEVQDFLATSNYSDAQPCSPFRIEWQAVSNWNEEEENNEMSGSSLLIPISKTSQSGFILRSLGYAEKIEAISNYSFHPDGTMLLSTPYKKTIAEERIWFINKNVRCRSSVLKSLNKKAILQTSFASEIRKIN